MCPYQDLQAYTERIVATTLIRYVLLFTLGFGIGFVAYHFIEKYW